MGGIFSRRKKTYWVPAHRKLEDKLEDLGRWKSQEDWTGWQIQNSLTDKVGDVLSKAGATAQVDLSFNGLGDDEMKPLAKVIKSTHCIKRLILQNNHIHDSGAKILAAALTPEKGADDPLLEELDLRNNSIGAEGATALAGVLTSNPNLKKLHLHWNHIGNKGLEAFCMNTRPDFPRDFLIDLRYNGFEPEVNDVKWDQMEQKLEKNKIDYSSDDPPFKGWPGD
mmetsp:Transcript_19186/g.29972  ORF Transcript_19186/g.29972 Transcript_19186/m.29972 type:complete len:224 (+) Transcript_19186:45-716(+)